MTPWAWYWKEPDDEAYGDECPTREAVIEAALREAGAGATVEIVEARMSEAQHHEGSDFIPFLRSRNKERIILSAEADTARSGPAGYGEAVNQKASDQ